MKFNRMIQGSKRKYKGMTVKGRQQAMNKNGYEVIKVIKKVTDMKENEQKRQNTTKIIIELYAWKYIKDMEYIL